MQIGALFAYIAENQLHHWIQHGRLPKYTKFQLKQTKFVYPPYGVALWMGFLGVTGC